MKVREIESERDKESAGSNDREKGERKTDRESEKQIEIEMGEGKKGRVQGD